MLSEETIKMLRDAPVVSDEEYCRKLRELMGDDDL